MKEITEMVRYSKNTFQKTCTITHLFCADLPMCKIEQRRQRVGLQSSTTY